MAKKSIDKWQFGDFQTPENLAKEVIETLKRNHAIQPDVIIEPSCGKVPLSAPLPVVLVDQKS